MQPLLLLVYAAPTLIGVGWYLYLWPWLDRAMVQAVAYNALCVWWVYLCVYGGYAINPNHTHTVEKSLLNSIILVAGHSVSTWLCFGCEQFLLPNPT
jgi:hypothetical protein